MNTQGYIKTEIINQVAYLTFFHLASNSLPSELLDKLTQAFNELGGNEQVKSIVLQSEGRIFCAGASFDELILLQDMEKAHQFFMGFANVINAMRKADKFIIVKVQGKAVGGGVGLIAAADYAMATDAAAIKLSELSIGIGPYVIAPALKRKMGNTALSEMSINAAHWHTAFWAREKGLFAQVFDNQNQLNEAVEILAEQLAKYDTDATSFLKKELWKGTEDWDALLSAQAEISARLVLQDFTKEKLANFKNK